MTFQQLIDLTHALHYFTRSKRNTVPIKHKYGLEGLHLIEADFDMVVSN